MKKYAFVYRNRNYNIALSADGKGICDVTIYRKREHKKWYQSHWEDFHSFVYCPSSMDDLIRVTKQIIDEVEQEETVTNNFLSEYRKLEDL